MLSPRRLFRTSLKISIIIPTFNQGAYIEKTLISIKEQDYDNTELIVIDGGSTDSTLQILKRYSEFIHYQVSEPDNGQGQAINKGFARATGDIIGWINSDDYYLPGYFNEIAKTFNSSPELDVVYGNSITLDERDNSSYPEYGKFLLDPFLRFGGAVYSHTVFWRKSVHENIDENITCAIDYELWMRLMRKRKYKHLNYFGAVFRMQIASKSMLGDRDFKAKWENDYLYIQQKHQLPPLNIWLSRSYGYINRIYSAFCALKFITTDLSKLR